MAKKVIGYGRVSTREQGEEGHGLDAQQRKVLDECGRRGWDATWLEDRGKSGKDLDRPAIQYALSLLADGQAEALVVAKLDRVSRSVIDFAGLMERARNEGWQLVILDLGVDTTTEAGELVAGIMSQLAQWERRIIGRRTREGLAEAREKGVTLGGDRYEGKRDPATTALVKAYSSTGMSVRSIAARLDEDGVPTPKGRRWHPTSVARILGREQVAA